MAKPLAGKRIVITRAREQSAEMVTKLRDLGATPILYPMIAFEPLLDAHAHIDAALQHAFDWILFTSQNGIRYFFEHPQICQILKIWQISVGVSGSKTAAKLAEYGFTADVVPDRFVGESLVKALGDVAGKRILLPRAKQGRPKIVAMLRERGAHVTEIPLYETVCPPPDLAAQQAIESGVEVITFASPSAVKGFSSQPLAPSPQPLIACIGPVTAKSAETHNLPVHIMPTEHTIDGMIDTIVQHYLAKNLCAPRALSG